MFFINTQHNVARFVYVLFTSFKQEGCNDERQKVISRKKIDFSLIKNVFGWSINRSKDQQCIPDIA